MSKNDTREYKHFYVLSMPKSAVAIDTLDRKSYPKIFDIHSTLKHVFYSIKKIFERDTWEFITSRCELDLENSTKYSVAMFESKLVYLLYLIAIHWQSESRYFPRAIQMKQEMLQEVVQTSLKTTKIRNLWLKYYVDTGCLSKLKKELDGHTKDHVISSKMVHDLLKIYEKHQRTDEIRWGSQMKKLKINEFSLEEQAAAMMIYASNQNKYGFNTREDVIMPFNHVMSGSKSLSHKLPELTRVMA